jgi:phosphoribosylanthranilate isomerase
VIAVKIAVKLCGLASLDDALAALDAGADLLGFVLVAGTPRYVAPARVAAIAAAVRARAEARVQLVGVFRNVPPGDVRALLDDCGLDLAQLHGAEPPADLAALGGRAYKVLNPDSVAEARAGAARYAGLSPPGGPDLLVDTPHAPHGGGAGRPAHHQAARALARRTRLLLAGGLCPANVAATIARVQPWGVDVSSGIESSPGKKDAARMAAFVTAVRRMERQDECKSDGD